MPRGYSSKLKERVSAVSADPPYASLGEVLAKFAVDKNVPLGVMCQLLDVSRMTVHCWFKGEEVSLRHQDKVMQVIEKLKECPVFSGPVEAAEYLIPALASTQLALDFSQTI